MRELAEAIDRTAAETRFSGVVQVDRSGASLARAYGLAHRAHSIPNTQATQFGIASGTKTLTALVIVSLIADGTLALDTPARSLLGTDLPLIDDAVTVEQLLAHRSGIGDYYDEELITDVAQYVLKVPVHALGTTESYLPALEGFPQKAPPGERFTYCNGGYVVLALLAERAAGLMFFELMQQRVCDKAGMANTAFLRQDELPGTAATGYLYADGLRTNALHLPVRGNGDGGIFTTASDIRALWSAFFGGRIVGDSWVAEMTKPRGQTGTRQYGLGLWLSGPDAVPTMLGGDAGVSFESACDPRRDVTYTILSNTSDGAWPIARILRQHLAS